MVFTEGLDLYWIDHRSGILESWAPINCRLSQYLNIVWKRYFDPVIRCCVVKLSLVATVENCREPMARVFSTVVKGSNGDSCPSL